MFAYWLESAFKIPDTDVLQSHPGLSAYAGPQQLQQHYRLALKVFRAARSFEALTNPNLEGEK